MTSSLLVLKNLFWLLLGPVLRLAIGIPLAGLTAHCLGLDRYGEFNLALSFVVMFGVLANLGLNEVLTRAIAQQPDEAQSLWSSVFLFKAGPLGAYIGVVIGGAWLLGYSATLLWLVLLLGLMQWVISLDNSARAVFAGQQRMEVLGGMEIAKVVIEAILSVSILLLGWGVIALAGVRVTVALLGLAMAMTFLARRLQVHLRWSRLAPTTALLPAGCRFAATSALSSIYERIGVVLLAQLVGAPGVALVSTALTLTEKIFWFVPAVQGAIFPFFSNLHVAAQDRLGSAFARALRYQTIIAVGCGLGLSLLGPWVIRLIFPTEFWPAGNLVAVLGWVCVPKLLGSFFLTVLQSVGRERQVSWLAGIQCAIYTCAVFTCVSRWGIPGFAWAALATEITGVMVQIILLTRLGIFVEISYGALLLIIGSGLVILFITLWLPGGRDNLVNLLGLLACYPVLVVVSRSLSGEDVRYLHGLWMNKEASAA